MRSYLKAIILCVAIFLSLHCFGQKSENPATTFKPFKWDLSLDAYNILKTGDALVMLRYKAHKSGAIRFKLGGGISTTTISSVLINSGPMLDLYTQKSQNLSIAAGYEFQKSQNKFQLFYGLEFGFTKQKSKYDFTANYTGPQFGGVQIPGVQLSEFVGIKYFVLTRLSVSSESYLTYRFQNSKSMDIDKPNTVAAQSKSNTLQFYGLKFLNVSFHF